eukprot:scaffold13320_cov14-Tisochrysis_lutea.AAC.1
MTKGEPRMSSAVRAKQEVGLHVCPVCKQEGVTVAGVVARASKIQAHSYIAFFFCLCASSAGKRRRTCVKGSREGKQGLQTQSFVACAMFLSKERPDGGKGKKRRAGGKGGRKGKRVRTAESKAEEDTQQ